MGRIDPHADLYQPSSALFGQDAGASSPASPAARPHLVRAPGLPDVFAYRSTQLVPTAIRNRWAAVSTLQRDIESLLNGSGKSGWGDAAFQRRVELVASSLRSAFPSRATALAFLNETRRFGWEAGLQQSPWGCVPDIAAQAAGLREGRPEGNNRRAADLLESHLCSIARDSWAAVEEMGLIVYVHQQQTPEGLWTSIPLVAQDTWNVSGAVHAGWLAGQSRWAASVGRDDLPPKFIFGLGADGAEISASDVQGIISATVPTFSSAAASRLDDSARQREPARQRG